MIARQPEGTRRYRAHGRSKHTTAGRRSRARRASWPNTGGGGGRNPARLRRRGGALGTQAKRRMRGASLKISRSTGGWIQLVVVTSTRAGAWRTNVSRLCRVWWARPVRCSHRMCWLNGAWASFKVVSTVGFVVWKLTMVGVDAKKADAQ
ncbi:hypothetical protein C8R47DRAFT_1101118 [Mycena vitilis]|nr:hypothetical protein C8R47DRAFT_1101118 [Mycena vitilis]